VSLAPARIIELLASTPVHCALEKG